jgi:hypothetical protein
VLPERLDAEPASLRRFAPEHVDALDLYELFRDDTDGVEAVFAYVPRSRTRRRGTPATSSTAPTPRGTRATRRGTWSTRRRSGAATPTASRGTRRSTLALVAVGYEDGNERSKRLVEAFAAEYGGRYDGRLCNWTPVGDRVLDHHRYSVSRAEWAANKQ